MMGSHTGVRGPFGHKLSNECGRGFYIFFFAVSDFDFEFWNLPLFGFYP